jgi:hypothetical protein
VTSRRRTPLLTITPDPDPPREGEPERWEGPSASTIAGIEKALTNVQHTLSIQFQRMAAMQAELDTLATTIRDQGALPPGRRRTGE